MRAGFVQQQGALIKQGALTGIEPTTSASSTVEPAYLHRPALLGRSATSFLYSCEASRGKGIRAASVRKGHIVAKILPKALANIWQKMAKTGFGHKPPKFGQR
jgi:hypothetical protein